MKINIDEMIHIIDINTKDDVIKFSGVYVKYSVRRNKFANNKKDKGKIVNFKVKIRLLRCPIIFNLISRERNT